MNALREAFADLRARLAARPDTEHEQGILRLIIGALLVLYFLPGTRGFDFTLLLYVASAHFAVGTLLLLRAVYSTNVSPLRRILAQLADVATITSYMAVCGESAAPLFLLYMWVTLGSGFRFGARYLVSELAMSVVGFGVAIY